MLFWSPGDEDHPQHPATTARREIIAACQGRNLPLLPYPTERLEAADWRPVGVPVGDLQRRRRHAPWPPAWANRWCVCLATATPKQIVIGRRAAARRSKSCSRPARPWPTSAWTKWLPLGGGCISGRFAEWRGGAWCAGLAVCRPRPFWSFCPLAPSMPTAAAVRKRWHSGPGGAACVAYPAPRMCVSAVMPVHVPVPHGVLSGRSSP